MPSYDSPSAAASSNPLVALAVAAIGAVLYVLQCIKWIVGWVTITVPRYVPPAFPVLPDKVWAHFTFH
jgi:hypothetical protein